MAGLNGVKSLTSRYPVKVHRKDGKVNKFRAADARKAKGKSKATH